MHWRLLGCVLFGLSLFSRPLPATEVDPEFKPTLRQFSSSTAGNATVYVTALQTDGKILAGGNFLTAGGLARSGVARFLPDKTIDPSFDAGDISVGEVGVSILSTGGTVRALQVQPDGKILVGGRYRRDETGQVVALERLNADGSRDPAFLQNQSPTIDGRVGGIVLQTDGKIIVGGTFTLSATNPSTGSAYIAKNLARLQPDGSVDFSFTGNASESSDTLALQPDGRILVGTSLGTITPPQLRRYSANGALEAILAELNFGIEELVLQPDGKILLGGAFTQIAGRLVGPLARLLPDGTIDPAFHGGEILNGTVYDFALDAAGRITVGGDFYLYDGSVTQFRVVRLTNSGARDPSFNIDRQLAGLVLAVTLLPDESAVLGGSFSVINLPDGTNFYENLALVRTDGTIDESVRGTFNVTRQGIVEDIALQPDGKVVLGGDFFYAEQAARRGAARYSGSGALDPTFDPRRNLGPVYSLAVQGDGKVLAANGGASILLQRLHPDGTVDFTFMSPFVSFSSSIQQRTVIRKILLQPDGRILVAGKLITGSATSPVLSGLVRLLPDGQLDSTFQIVAARGGVYFVNDIALQPDGQVVLGGDFTNVNGDASYHYLARVSASGLPDPSFRPVTPSNGVSELEVQPDGKVIFGGRFGSLLRVNPDGTADGFAVPVNDFIEALALQADGRILVGGEFTSIGGVPRQRLARLQNDGTVDPTFQVTANSTVHVILPANDGSIWLGGLFTRIDGQSRLGAARLRQIVPSQFLSQRNHGAAGIFSVALPLGGVPGVEPRNGGSAGDYDLIVRFPAPVSYSGTTLEGSNGQIRTQTGSGSDTLVIGLSGVADQQRLQLVLHGVNDGRCTDDVFLQVVILVGDVTGDGVVNAGDTLRSRQWSGEAASAQTFRADINGDGVINAGDVLNVRQRTGNFAR